MTRSLPTIMECTGGPTSRAVTEKIAWYMKRLPGPYRGAGIQLLPLRYADVEEHPLKLENEDWCLTSALINILMMLSKPLQKTFLYSIDTLGQVIDENPVFSPPSCMLFIYHLLHMELPWGCSKLVAEIMADLPEAYKLKLYSAYT